MLTALKYKDVIKENFYLDKDDITVRRKKDGYHGRYKKHDIVEPYTLKGNNGYDYKGVHIPRTRTSISFPWLLTILRGIDFKDGDVIDHVDGDISNNKRDNLRLVSQRINSHNRKKNKNNTSGYTGIHYNKKARLYMVRRAIHGKRVYKSSKTIDGAIKLLNELTELGKMDGYTDRHGK